MAGPGLPPGKETLIGEGSVMAAGALILENTGVPPSNPTSQYLYYMKTYYIINMLLRLSIGVKK